MPKKYQGENSKATAARARKEAAKQEEYERKQAAIEDAKWADDDRSLQKKQQRKDDKMKKRQDVLDRKQQNRLLEEEEMNSLKAVKPTPVKVTRAHIQANQEQKIQASSKPRELMHDEKPLEENINRLEIDGVDARNVDDAISALSESVPSGDKHPERRMRAAYLQFEEANLPRLKAENPNMRLSQLKQVLKKEWMKSPTNPMNQMTVS